MSDNERTVTAQTVLFAQLNDVYQIDTSADYTDSDALILPRIGTLVRRLREAHGAERFRFCVPGDFLAPSCLSKEFKGEQMVDILNRIGVDLASLGNHEFERDIGAADFEARVNESKFKWLNSNFQCDDEALQDRLENSGKMIPVEIIHLSTSHYVSLSGVLNTETNTHIGTAHPPADSAN